MREILPIIKKNRKKLLLFFILIPFLWLLSGLYSVDQNEAALPVIMGKPAALRGPGIHYNIPYPFCEVYKTDIKKTETVSIGFDQLDYDGMDSQSLKGTIIRYTGNSRETVFMDMNIFNQQFMTGDENIISLEVEITYVVIDPEAWLFNFDNPRRIIENEASSIINKVVGSLPIDSIIVRDPQLELGILNELRQIIESHDCGVEITSATFRSVSLPVRNVGEAYRDVKSAEDDRTKRIEEARREATTILSQGKTTATEMIDKAVIEANGILNKAQTESEVLEKLLVARQQERQFDYRLYLDTMEEIMKNNRKYLINPSESIETILIERKNE